MAKDELYQPKLFRPNEAHYLFPNTARVAIDVALATGRPVLVSGPPGCGKTELAKAAADSLGWRYLKQVVTSRTQFEDLTGRFDTLRRLNDAQAARAGESLPPDWAYLVPGSLWWAFNPKSALDRGATAEEMKEAAKAAPTRPITPAQQREGWVTEGRESHAVVLLDEIDKADPDVPNDLLEPLDLCAFTAMDRRVTAEGNSVLVIITTNGERELPQAFLRRCISLELEDPDADRLTEIAHLHFDRDYPAGDGELYRQLAEMMVEERERIRAKGLRAPSTAEYLDAVKACLKLPIRPNEDFWSVLKQIVLIKQGGQEEL